MSYSTEYLENGQGILHVGRGTVTGSEILDAAVAFRSAETRAKAVRYGIIDFTEATELQVSTDEVRQIVAENKKTAAITPGATVAIVAGSDLAFGMSRMWQAFMENTGWSVEVFRSRKEALDWVLRAKR